jgi:hypothetical protein
MKHIRLMKNQSLQLNLPASLTQLVECSPCKRNVASSTLAGGPLKIERKIVKKTVSIILGTSLFFITPYALAEEFTDEVIEASPSAPADPAPADPAPADPAPADPEPSGHSGHPDNMAPDEVGGWAVVDENGNVTNIIVCTPEVCGSGTFGGNTVIFQTHKGEDGNVAGHWNSQYDAEKNVWTVTDAQGNTYELPKDYPGNFQGPVCYENCNAVSNPNGEGFIDLDDNSTDAPVTLDLSCWNGPDLCINQIPTEISNTATTKYYLYPRVAVFSKIYNQSIVTRSKAFIGKKTVRIVASKNNENFFWKIKANKNGLVRFKIPEEYIDWSFRVVFDKKIVYRISAIS